MLPGAKNLPCFLLTLHSFIGRVTTYFCRPPLLGPQGRRIPGIDVEFVNWRINNITNRTFEMATADITRSPAIFGGRQNMKVLFALGVEYAWHDMDVGDI